MTSTIGQPLTFLLILLCLGLVEGHGRLIEPPSRSSMWRFGYSSPINYNDNQLFCGGFGIQYSPAVAGRCGVCGDPWFGPRENEVGGKYATGTIVRKYRVGQVIDVTIDLTANHKGYFEFRLCQKDDPRQRATWDCMNKHVLIDDATGLTRYSIQYVQYATKIDIKLRLPVNVECKACVLQWKYNAGNSWGVDKDTGKGCVGCGNQEQFYGCADVAIGYEYDSVTPRHSDQGKDNPCVYEKVKGDEWRWRCSGKLTSGNLNNDRDGGDGGSGDARTHTPLLFLYLCSVLLFVFHNVLCCS